MGALTVAPPAPTNNYSLIQLLNQAHRLAGGLKQPGMGMSPSESQEALDVLNFCLDGMKIENLLIVSYLRTYQQMNTNQQNYSVGPGGDFNIARPEKIHGAGFILQGGTSSEAELPMQVLLSYDAYQAFVAKNIGSAIPLVLYYQATLVGGLYGTATIWPIPNTQSQIVLYTQSTLEQYLTIDDPVYVPAGYFEMLMYQLAVRLHQRPPWNARPMDPSVFEMATFYKERVKNQQLTPIYMVSDPAACQRDWENATNLVPRAWIPWAP